MKKIINLLLVLVLAISTFALTTSFFAANASQNASSTLVKMEIETRIYGIVEEIQKIVPVENDEAVAKLIQTIDEDERIGELIDTYATRFLHDVVSEAPTTIDINSEVQEALLKFSDEFGAVMGDVINPEYKEMIIRGIITRIDFNSYYEGALVKIKDSMKPSQLSMVRFVNHVIENQLLYKVISLVVVLLSAAILYFKNRGFKTISLGLMVSAALHLMSVGLMPLLIDAKLPRLNGVFDFKLYLVMAIVYLVLGLALYLNADKRQR